jgi:hypothetical protein
MDEPSRFGQVPILVRYNVQMGKIGLGLAGVVDSFDRNHHNTRVARGKVVMTAFELNQLDHADRSPSPSKKDDCAILIAEQVALGEWPSVGSCGLERRERPTDRQWS